MRRINNESTNGYLLPVRIGLPQLNRRSQGGEGLAGKIRKPVWSRPIGQSSGNLELAVEYMHGDKTRQDIEYTFSSQKIALLLLVM